MSEHKVKTQWKRETPDFKYATYNRDHEQTFEGGVKFKASSAPEFKGNPQYPNPEELLVAALSSCHMLTFLAVCAKRNYTVNSYEDSAVGTLERNEKGKMAVTQVVLTPKVTFQTDGDPIPDDEQLKALHEKAHQECFIANSVSTKVSVLGL